MKKTFALLLTTLLMSLISFSIQTQESDYLEPFDDPEIPGWEHSPNTFVEGGVLVMESNSFAFHEGFWAEMEMVVQARFSGVGELLILYSWTDTGSYILRLGRGYSILEREQGGEIIELGRSDISILDDDWFNIVIVTSANSHQVILRDQPIITAAGEDLLPEGGFGFRITGEARGEFDELAIFSQGAAAPPAEEAAEESTSEVESVPPVSEIAAGTPAYEQLPWIYTGGPVGGLGYDVRMDPRNPDIMYVTDALAGVFKSLDGGVTWFPSNEGITTRVGTSTDAIPIFSLSLDPNDPDVIWVGTQFASGVFRSENAGTTWEDRSNGILEHGLTIRGFTVEPGNSDVIYLAGEVSSWEWAGEPQPGFNFDKVKGVVYKTTDGGDNWTRIWYGDNLARYIWIHPTDNNLLYVSTGIFDREAANSDQKANEPGGVGILRSRDGGGTWEVLGVEHGFRPDELYLSSLYMHPQNPDMLLAAAANDAYAFLLDRPLGAIYTTQDGGDSWKRSLDLPAATSVEVCERNSEVIYASSIAGVYRSGDTGQSWESMTGDLWGAEDTIAGFPIDMQCDPRDPNRVFINNYGGGNYLSEDGGRTWTVSSQGYTGAIMSQVVVAQDDPALIYTTARSGVFMSNDGGQTWQGMARGEARLSEARGLAVNPTDPSHIITNFLDLWFLQKISYDSGQTWKDVDLREWFPVPEGHGPVPHKLAFSPHDPQLVFAISGDTKCALFSDCNISLGVLRSTDGGETWERSNLDSGAVLDLAFSPDGYVYAGLHSGDIYRSTDGMDWELVSTGVFWDVNLSGSDPDALPPVLSAIEIDANNSQHLYTGFSYGGVKISMDGGQNWESSSAGMPPESSVLDLAVDSAHPGVVYAATVESGVYVSTDSGATWTAINEGLLNRASFDLALSADGSVLYLATEGAGVFRLGAVREVPELGPDVEQVEEPAPEEEQAEEQAPSVEEELPEQDGGSSPCAGNAILPLAVVGLLFVWQKSNEED
ncbi:MAG: hypothetical protein DWQ07_23525 [Chloroflexi bacterium]|nr:MAG: hypothetical protein DWQ07_23525 [Chloroflexota bacterium]MBL1194121.1 hypothetical protein [Chloroflexota bacterium]NOH11414.1 hypothetical protein [Chloroflexota bacterium]